MTLKYIQEACIWLLVPFVAHELIATTNAAAIPADPASSPSYSPIILVHGLMGTRLYGKVNKTTVPSWFCPKKTDDYFQLWVSAKQLLPPNTDCWLDNMRLLYDREKRMVYNNTGVEIMVDGFGNTTTVECLDPGLKWLGIVNYLTNMVTRLVKAGFVRGKSVRAATYDWRVANTHNPWFLQRFRDLVEDTYNINGDKKVVLACHSLGGNVCLDFLNRQSQEWKDRYLRSMISLGTPIAGVPSVAGIYATGNSDAFYVLPKGIRGFGLTFTSLATMLPMPQVFDPKTDILFQTPTFNYTAATYKELFQALNFTDGNDIWLDSKPYNDKILERHPGVDVHCIVGTGGKTVERVVYSGQFPHGWSNVINGPGDGTVNLKSAQYCLKWLEESRNPHNKKVFYKEFKGINHYDLARADAPIEAIIDILKLPS